MLTVLDFVGHHRKEFRFDQRLRALTGETRRGLAHAVERGFPFLASGCQIVMDRQSQSIVLENIRNQVGQRWPQMVAELREHGEQDLATFLRETGLELSDVLRQGQRSWTELRQSAGLPTRDGGGAESALLKRVRALAHVDDVLRAQIYDRLLGDDAPSYDDLSPLERTLAQMLFFSLWPGGGGYSSIDRGLAELREEPAVRDELRAVVDLAFERAPHVTTAVHGALKDLPLQVHATYQREEVLAALGYASLSRKPNSFREGVLYVPEIDTDAFFVTLQKSEADYSPTTLYRDYPISPTLFHWESQSTTSVTSKTGQRYLSGSSTKLLFVRQHKSDEFGTSAYLFAGPLRYVQHSGDRPIAITWQLERALPGDFFQNASVAAV